MYSFNNKYKLLKIFFVIIILYVIFINIYTINNSTNCDITFFLTNDRRKDKKKLRIVQYNVEWLFIENDSDWDCPGKGCDWKNVNEAKIHMNFIAKIINDLDPDLIVLCEVHGCNELNILKNKLDGTYTSYLKKGTDKKKQNVALLSRINPVVNLYRTEERVSYPIPESHCGYKGPTMDIDVMKHFITEFNFDNMNVALIAAHLLAMPNDPKRCAEREAQATILQNVIMSYISKGYEIIVIGDFNDFDEEVIDLKKNKPNSQVVDILKGYKGKFSGKYKLYNVSENIEQSQRYSNYHDSDKNQNTYSKNDFSLIDYILVTNEIKNKISKSFIYQVYEKHYCKYCSDHYPIVIDLDYDIY